VPQIVELSTRTTTSVGSMIVGSATVSQPRSAGVGVTSTVNATSRQKAEFMDGLAKAPGTIDPAELTGRPNARFMIGDPVVALVLMARRGDTHQTRWLSRVLGSRAGGTSSGPIEDQSKARRRI
jgi:hypothetical protein